MAIPSNQFTPAPIPAAFLPPLDDAYNPLHMRATGGIALNDGSKGREVQFWHVDYDGNNILVSDASNIVRFVLTIPGVLAVCLAFDSNMAVALGYMTSSGGHLYFYNGLINSYATLDFPDITSCRVAVDKTSDFFNGQSDVVFGYVNLGTTAHYRYQRERYAIEHDVVPNPVITSDNALIKLGPTTANRLEFEFRVPVPPPPPVPLGSTIDLPRPILEVVRVVKVSPIYS